MKIEQFLPGGDRMAVTRTGLFILKDGNLKLSARSWPKLAVG